MTGDEVEVEVPAIPPPLADRPEAAAVLLRVLRRADRVVAHDGREASCS